VEKKTKDQEHKTKENGEKKKENKKEKISKRVLYKRTCLASWQAFSGEFRIS
jgi:hypothetical protein